MDKGNWIPISKVFVKHLPKGREYSQVEAAFSLQVDYDCENKVTVSGYAALWRWSRNKVTRFMDEMNVKIVYPENIRRKQNQKGQIAIQNMNRNRTDKGQIRVIENSDLKVSGNRSETDEGQMKDRSRYTTKEPITLKPKPDIKDYTPEIKNFVDSYQEYVSDNFKNLAPKRTKAFLSKCYDTIDKLTRLDGFTFQEVYDCIQWGSQDDFWAKQIRSLSNIRAKGKNGDTKFVNMMSSFKENKNPKLNAAEQRLKRNLEVSKEWLSEQE